MLVLVTGGTGFVGSHALPAIVGRGHRVRLLARDAGRGQAVLDRHGLDGDVVVGDITDVTSVERAVAGCDAVIHAAAAIGVTGPGGAGASDVDDQNFAGARNVLGAALHAGCDPVVHVSTVAVFLPPTDPVITVDSPLASPRNAYGRSKVAAERWARARQDKGDPVTIVYPGGVVGPDQASLDATLEGIASARKIAWPVAPGGVGIIDVRDLAEVLAATLVPGRGPRRLLVGGHFRSWPELGELTDDICGVRARRLPLPKGVLLVTGSVLDVVRRFVRIDYPLTRDAAEIMATMVPTDDGPTLAATGVALRPLRETLEDALRWLVAAGHLPASAAPRLEVEDP